MANWCSVRAEVVCSDRQNGEKIYQKLAEAKNEAERCRKGVFVGSDRYWFDTILELDNNTVTFSGDEFYVPHSRHTEVRREDIEKVPELKIISESQDAGVYMVMARGGREFFITGHSEYAPNTLDDEYKRHR